MVLCIAHASVVCGACRPAEHFIVLTGGLAVCTALKIAQDFSEYSRIPLIKWLSTSPSQLCVFDLFCWLSRDLGGREIDFHSCPEHDRRIKKVWQTLNNGQSHGLTPMSHKTDASSPWPAVKPPKGPLNAIPAVVPSLTVAPSLTCHRINYAGCSGKRSRPRLA